MIRNPSWLLEKGNVFSHLIGVLEIGWAIGMIDVAAQWCHQKTHLSALLLLVLDSTSNQKQLAAAVSSIMSKHGDILKRKGHCLSCGFLLGWEDYSKKPSSNSQMDHCHQVWHYSLTSQGHAWNWEKSQSSQVHVAAWGWGWYLKEIWKSLRKKGNAGGHSNKLTYSFLYLMCLFTLVPLPGIPFFLILLVHILAFCPSFIAWLKLHLLQSWPVPPASCNVFSFGIKTAACYIFS